MGLRPVSVTQLNQYIKRILQSDPILGNISVTGEISNLKFHGSGHVYFSLKDPSSTVNCFLPADRLHALAFRPEEGMEVICHGYLYLYERGGRYSINIRDMEESGEGRLMAEFRRLQAKLEAEGLFDPAHKKPIPRFPRRIAIVTSETGAAVRDILKILRSKNDLVDILIYPVLVQGPAAAAQIAAAIDDLNENFPDVDTIIAGRGGGSLEDLWAFNEEIVARSIYRSRIPVISAVGHEIDFTIADFAADRRAETPTAAAEMAVPDTGELRQELERMAEELKRDLRNRLQLRQQRLSGLDPEHLGRDLRSRVIMEQMQTENMMEGMKLALERKLSLLAGRVEIAGETLAAADPGLLLGRGYSIVRSASGEIVTDAGSLAPAERISITFGTGRAEADIISTACKGESEER